jgi:hypothetical protein
MGNDGNIGELIVRLKNEVKLIEQATQHSPAREDVEVMLHDLIHTAAQAVYVLNKTKQ